MAKLKFPADILMDLLVGGPNFITLNGVAMDPVTRVVTFDVVGGDVPDAELVALKPQAHSKLVPVE